MRSMGMTKLCTGSRDGIEPVKGWNGTCLRGAGVEWNLSKGAGIERNLSKGSRSRLEPVGREAEVERYLPLGELTCLKEAGVNKPCQKEQGYAGGRGGGTEPAQREIGRKWFW
jgi:hypothetical protein